MSFYIISVPYAVHHMADVNPDGPKRQYYVDNGAATLRLSLDASSQSRSRSSELPIRLDCSL